LYEEVGECATCGKKWYIVLCGSSLAVSNQAIDIIEALIAFEVHVKAHLVLEEKL